MLRRRWINLILLALALAFLVARFVHLSADYPRHVTWEHGVATDEGWYASSAINQQTWGTWLLPGDFNTSVTLPVWQWIAAVVFHFAGFGIVPLRAAAVVIFIACVLLLCRIARHYGAGEWVPLLAFMLAANPFCFVLSRNGFLEFPLLLFFLLCISVAILGEANFEGAAAGRMILAGICFALAALTKTTAFVLLPVAAYAVLHSVQFRWRVAAARVAILASTTAAIYAGYWLAYARYHLADWNYFLVQNASTFRLTPYAILADVSRPIRSGFGSDLLLFPLCLIVLAGSIFLGRGRKLWLNPLYALSALFVLLYLGFMAEHNNAPARYYALVIPAFMLMAIALLQAAQQRNDLRLRNILLVLLLLDAGVNSVRVAGFLLHPLYMFRDANAAIRTIIESDPDHNSVILADNSHELALFEGTKPVNLIWHEGGIGEQVERLQPGWWIQFTHGDTGDCFREVLSARYKAERRGTWEIFDGYSDLVLWKLVAIPGGRVAAPLSREQTVACSPPVYMPSPREGKLFR
jgi:4-amino-4-deoxy-L-arabinose transferase-like glycosyltransferase